MKKRMKNILLTLSVLGLFTACHFNNTPQEKASYLTSKIQKKLKLNSLQKEKLDLIATRVIKLKDEHQQTKEVFKLDLKKLITQDVIKEEEIRTLMDKKRTQLEVLIPQILPEVLDFHASLNLKQKEKLVSMMERFAKKRHSKYRH